MTNSTPCSKSLSKTNLKTKIVSTGTKSSGGGLFILRNERQPVRNSILERQDLVRIGSDIGRVSDRYFFAESSAERQARGRRRTGSSAYHRADLKTGQTEEFARGALRGRVDQSVS